MAGESCGQLLKNEKLAKAGSSAHPPFRAEVKLSFKYEVQRAHRADREVEESLELAKSEFGVNFTYVHIIACTFSESLQGP